MSTEPVEVWIAMADHFLDTETRHDIPLTAMRCVEAGLSVAEARDIWCYGVCPAVGANALSVAGEWAGWDTEWLVDRIRLAQNKWRVRPRLLRWIVHVLRVRWPRGEWAAIERCMVSLSEIESVEDGRRMAKDYAYLARHFFDFNPGDPAQLDGATRGRLRALFEERFLRIIEPATVPGESMLGALRVRKALQAKG